MLQENVKGFFEFVGADAKRKETVESMTPEELLQYAHENGFQVTLEELKQGVETVTSSLPQDTRELSEEDLDQAAGGLAISGTTLAFIVGGALIVGAVVGALAVSYFSAQEPRPSNRSSEGGWSSKKGE